jgi:hypothetical protein
MGAKSAEFGSGSGLSQVFVKRRVTNGVELVNNFDASQVYATNWRRRNWQTVANWKSLLESQGWLPTTTYTDNRRQAKIVGSPNPITFRLKTDPRSGWNVKSSVAPQPNWTGHNIVPAFDGDLLIDAKNKALQKAKQQRINLSVSVAEGGDTIRMLTKTVRTLGESYSSFRKGRFKQAARRLNIGDIEKSLANNWLAYRLGWLPLIQDSVGLIDAHRDQYSTARDNHFTVRASKTKVVTSVYEDKGYLVGTGSDSLEYRTDVFVGRAGMLLKITSKLDQFQASVGLSSGDILSTAWELVPFSFVFDYFVDVGSWMGNLTALSGIQVLDAWQIQEISRTSNYVPCASSNALYYTNHPPRFMWDRFFNRSPWAPGSLTWPRTRSITDQSAIRLTTMAALFSQLTRGDPPIGKFRPKSSD